MVWVILIIIFVTVLILYVFGLDFEIGTGFSEEKRKAREATYKITKKDPKKGQKRLE